MSEQTHDSVAYLGPPGTFCHRAAELLAQSDQPLIDASDIASVFSRVAAAEVSAGVVPIRNSLAGLNLESAKALEEHADVHIRKCIGVAVTFSVYGRHSDESLLGIASHPTALLQCDRWIHSRGLATMELSSTAQGLERLARGQLPPGWGAIGAPGNEERYGLTIIARSVEDDEHLTTYFVWLECCPTVEEARPLPGSLILAHGSPDHVEAWLNGLRHSLGHFQLYPTTDQEWALVELPDSALATSEVLRPPAGSGLRIRNVGRLEQGALS